MSLSALLRSILVVKTRFYKHNLYQSLLLPQYFLIKQKIKCPNEIKGQVLNLLSERFSRYKLNRIDGLRVDFDDGWLLLRPSGTEPIFRCFSEAKNSERAKELAELGMQELEACAKTVGSN